MKNELQKLRRPYPGQFYRGNKAALLQPPCPRYQYKNAAVNIISA